MGVVIPQVVTEVSASGAQVIDGSLKFDNDKSTYLTRTPGSAGNQTTWTWSAWIKKATVGSSDRVLFQGGNTDFNDDSIRFNSSDALSLSIHNGSNARVAELTSTAVFRDPSAWYHVVVVFDTSNNTADDRIRFYVNGSQLTAFSTRSNPSQNLVSHDLNAASIHLIGTYRASSQYFDGYLADVHFVDGTALDASSFGETVDGSWVPKEFSGSHGTNGFHLKFNNTSDLGEDSAGSNDWTANSFSTSAGTGNDVLADSPTAYNDGGNGVGNYATLNPLEKGSDTTLSDGNLKAVSTNGTGWESHCSTLSVSTGKWYFETECVAGSVFSIGIADASDDISDLYTTGLSPAYAYNYNGKKYSGNVTDGGIVASSFTAGDLIGCAFDLDAGTIRFYKNGVDEGEFYNNVTSNVTYKAAASTRNATVVVNFGQRAFDNLPTGYKALNSYNT